MNTAETLLLFEYSDWASSRVLAKASLVSAEQYTAPFPVSHGSLRGTLVHQLGAEMVWRVRCQEGISPDRLPGEDELPTLEALTRRWEAENVAMRSFLNSITDQDLLGPIEYRTTKGKPFSQPLWQILVHLLNHATQHRSEAAAALTAFGHSPGDLDLILFLRNPSG
jgi:uncharacterized damage-inducible protein DinB